MCGSCSAPMALIHESVAQEREPRIVSIVGESHVGKTIYLGLLLDMLARRARDFEAVPKGAYSVNLQQNVVAHLAHRQFPPKTPMEPDQWYWTYYQVCRKRHGEMWVDLVMPDMAGEALSAEVDSPKTFSVIRNLLDKTEAAMVLVDGALAASGSTQPDFFALKLMTYLDDMFAIKRRQRIANPIAVVLCKADYCPECFTDPAGFARTNLNRLWNICETRFSRVRFFASSVVGSLGFATGDDESVVPVPLHSAPRGILEPFEWILDQM
ncbi:MAG: TRAFAC clade GTPase domain-containing protein [Planctomycetota bacterium]